MLGSFFEYLKIVVGWFWDCLLMILGSFWMSCGIVFGLFLNPFGMFFDRFGIILGSCLDHFGIAFGSFLDCFQTSVSAILCKSPLRYDCHLELITPPSNRRLLTQPKPNEAKTKTKRVKRPTWGASRPPAGFLAFVFVLWLHLVGLITPGPN